MELRTLLGLDRASVKLTDGTRLFLKPLTLPQSLVIDRFFEPVAMSMAELGMSNLEVYDRHSQELIDVVAVATGRTAEEISDKWTEDDFQAVWAKLLSLNKRFFLRRVVRGAASQARKESLSTGESLPND